MTFDAREAAVVDSVTAGPEDHGILTGYVHLRGREDGWGQGFGGLGLDAPHLEDWKASLASFFGVQTYEEIKGRHCFVLRSWDGWGSPIEGLEVDGRRWTLTAFRRKHWPDKTRSVLEEKAERIRNQIHYAGRDVQRFVKDLETVADGYVDWELPNGSDPHGR